MHSLALSANHFKQTTFLNFVNVLCDMYVVMTTEQEIQQSKQIFFLKANSASSRNQLPSALTKIKKKEVVLTEEVKNFVFPIVNTTLIYLNNRILGRPDFKDRVDPANTAD